MSRNNRFLGLVAASMLFACGDPPPATPDAGTDSGTTPDGGGGDDAGRDGGGGGNACTTARAVTLTVGANTLSGNTTEMGSTLPRTDGCGGMGTTAGTVGQEVLAFTLPGTATDRIGILFSTEVDGTAEDFDTVLELRTTCTSATGSQCIDDGAAEDYRSVGTYLGMGGSSLFAIVSGYQPAPMDFVNEGPWGLSAQVFLNPEAPTFTSGTATFFDAANLVMTIVGADDAGAADALRFTFLSAAGTPIGIDLDNDSGTPDEIELVYLFNPSVTGMTTFTSEFDLTTLIAPTATEPGVYFADFPQLADATQLRVAILNSFGQASEESTLPLGIGTTVGLGATCDATHRCDATMTCTAGACAAAADVLAACGTATPVVVATPTTMTTTAATTVTLDDGEGLFAGSCLGGRGGDGDEVLLSVTVPAGAFDLLVDTSGAMTGTTDTLVFDRSVCADPRTETGCNDDDERMPDAEPAILTSYLEVLDASAGVHTIAIDAFETLEAAATVNVTVSLRPVLATGATCDPTGAANRCASANCPTTGAATCP